MAFTRVRAFPPAVQTPRDTLFKRLLAAADLTAVAGGLIITALITGQQLVAASIATLPVILLIMNVSGRYEHDGVVLRKSTLDEAPALTALAAAYALVWSLVTITFNVHSSRGAVILLWATSAALLIMLRAVARAIGHRFAPPERVLIIGGSRARAAVGRRLAADAAERVTIVGQLPLEDDEQTPNDGGPQEQHLSVEDLGELVEQLEVQRVILIPTNNDLESMSEAVAAANSLGLKVSIVPQILQVVGSSVEFDQVGGVTVLGLRRPGLSRSSTLVKRGMDIVSSALGLVILAPFGLLIAVAIKLDSPGPVFFRQPRIGRNGKTFQMIKFRSMIDKAEAQRPELELLNESDGIFKMNRDPRITRVGRWLRPSSIDELPQLMNVLRGEMSLVGPRPLVPEEDRRIEGRHRSRLQLSPGMTGPWQVLGPQRPPLDEMVKIDYLYGANWSLWSDMKFLLRTVSHVFARRGT